METKKLLVITVFLLTSACAMKQKRVCVQNVAYQHGYQAAQKGESVDGSSTYQGNICQDYEAYSPTIYRQDFKAGYFKGKKEYCSEYNYKKWGKQQAKSSQGNSPTDYPANMKICLQDPEYKKQAQKDFQESFKEAYCDSQRFAEKGREQAKNFEPLKVPDITSTCSSNKTTEMKTAMRKSYNEQMKTNCTPSFWLIKGEEDAKAKKSKSVELSKVQKCPASKRDALMSKYSKAYNERKALLIEEEKLALERQRHKEQMDLAKKKQQQNYELEKERLQIQKDQYNPGYSGGIPSGRPSYRPGSPQYFYYKGSKLYSKCRFNSQKREARVLVKNLSSRHVNLSGNWLIQYFDKNNRLIKTEKEYEHLSLWKNERKEFFDRFSPSQARYCVARMDQRR